MSPNCPVLRRRSFAPARNGPTPACGSLIIVAQVSKPAVSPTSRSARRELSNDRQISKSALTAARWCSLLTTVLLLQGMAHAQSWADVPGWPGLEGVLIPQDFPSPQLSFSASPDTLTFWWPAYGSNFILESSADLASGVWTRQADPNRFTFGDAATITTIPFDSDQKYFRLRAPLTFSVPIFEFGIFYNSLLEFTWQATLAVNGPVYADADIFVGSSANLTFNAPVVTTRGIYKTNWDGHTIAQMTGVITYNSNPRYVTNAMRIEVPFGTNNTPAAIREMLNLPPPGEDPNSIQGSQRYYNLAGVALLVTETNVSAYLKTSPTDAPTVLTVTNYGFLATNNPALRTTFPFLSVTNSFIDQRELSKTVRATQIDVGIYKSWLVTNPTVMAKFPPYTAPYPNMLYVADLRIIGENTNLYSVRLVDGVIIPTNGPPGQPSGWTVATPNPLYVWGNYNIGPGGVLGSPDTSKTYPAALISDALTILSGSWLDFNSGGSLGSRGAASTTVNAAILTGIVYSTDGSSNHFSGGVMNLPRLLEDWSNDTLTLNTSIVNLFYSARATNRFVNPGVYYYAPTRQFSFDQNFTNSAKLPPGTPLVRLDVAPP